MAAYLIARVNVTDMEKYKNYIALSPAAIAAAGGKFLARGGEVVNLEGPQETNRMVVVEFPSLEAAQKFYNSDLYVAARKEREEAAEGQFIILDGVEGS